MSIVCGRPGCTTCREIVVGLLAQQLATVPVAARMAVDAVDAARGIGTRTFQERIRRPLAAHRRAIHMMTDGDGFERIGEAGVSCGMLWVGDAGEVARREELVGGERVGPSRVVVVENGVALTAGGGSGLYPVYVRRQTDGRIAEVRIVFIDVAGDPRER